MKKLFILLLIFVGVWQLSHYSGDVQLGPGVMAGDVPIQKNTDSKVIHTLNEYNITEIAIFHIKAKVLSKKNYRFGREADLSPLDLALGWGNMSDEGILENIEVSQSGRFYRWRVDSFPIPRREIETHSANMHLIPANESIERDMKRILNGDIVEITGSLVNVVSTNDGWRWKSSQTRNDTGNGACELVWVESLRILNR